MRLAIGRIMLVPLMISVMLLAGCGTTNPASVEALRRIVGTDLVGTKGATPADQRGINRTVVGICAAKVWTAAECRRHGEAVQ